MSDLLLRFKPIGLLGRLRFAASSAMLAYGRGYTKREEDAALRWLERWAGPSATQAIWRPMMNIKFGAAADQIPLAWMAGRLRQRVRSRKVGTEMLGYLRGSLQLVVDRLTTRLRDMGVELRLGTAARELLVENGAVTGVSTDHGLVHAERLLSTVPTPVLANLLRRPCPDYAAALDEVDYFGAICVVLALDRPLSSVYWLNVADPGFDFGGVIEQTNLVPANDYGGRHLVYLSRYLPVDGPLWNMLDEELVERQLDQLTTLARIDVRQHLQRSWVFRAKYAAPLTDLGFHRRIPDMRSPVAGLYVAAMPHVYPDERSFNNSIRVAAAAVDEMGIVGPNVPTGFSLSGVHGRGNGATKKPGAARSTGREESGDGNSLGTPDRQPRTRPAA
jgi:protoporphyrinogen oxidase